ncbi:MAG: hypothetical protein ACK417_02230 [Bacteroidia bacterium]
MYTALALPFNWSSSANRIKNQRLLLDTSLFIPTAMQGRYKVGKSIRLHYQWDNELQLASIKLVQAYTTIGFLPLPEAQQVYAWKKAGKRFSFRIPQAFGESNQLRIRFTQP